MCNTFPRNIFRPLHRASVPYAATPVTALERRSATPVTALEDGGS